MDTNTATAEAPKAVRIKGEDKKVKLSTVIELLKAGKTRKEIKTELQLTNSQAKTLFGHDKVKGKKRHYTKNVTKAEIEVEDDLPEEELDLDEDETVGEEIASSNGNGSEATAAPVPETAKEEW